MPTITMSKKPKFKQRGVVNRSSVDESLFGSPARFKQMTGNRAWSVSSTTETVGQTGQRERSETMGKEKRSRRMSHDPEVVQIITKDLIRKMKVPSTPDPSGRSVVLDTGDYGRMLHGAKSLTLSDRKQLEMQQKEEQTSRLEASNSRKKAMQGLEFIRKQNEQPSDLEEEKMEKSSELIVKASTMMEEEDDEIKALNEYVHNAKCHAIRDAQLKEKGDIKDSTKEENARLDLMMEVERLKAVEHYDRKEKEMQLQRYMGAEVILDQIKDREQYRLLQLERKDQETHAMLRYLDRLQEEDLEALEKKRERQKVLMVEVKQCNDEMHRQKAQLKHQLKIEDLKVLEYIKEKMRVEEELQMEMEQQKAEKEREIARLRAQQERAKDKQAERDALRAKRRQEEFERIARNKERMEAQKKRETENMLITARHQQIQHKEHFLAMQAMQDRMEFERVLGVQQHKMTEDKDKATKMASLRKSHAQELRKQVHGKETEKVMARKAFFEEGTRLDHEAKERKKKLDIIKQRKLSELKAAGVPDKYCAEVSRRITAPPPSFTMSGALH